MQIRYMAQKPKKVDIYRGKEFTMELADIQKEKFRRMPSHTSLASKLSVRGTKPTVGEIEPPASNGDELLKER